jgi:hydroxyacylglutathione hydrolase
MATLYLRQLLAGRDFARGDRAATGMQNFVYLVGDRDAGECLVVDAAWDVAGILEVAQADDMKVVGALVTHYHPDHVGGDIFGHSIEGLPRLMELCPCKVHAHRAEVDGVRFVTGLERGDVTAHDSGDRVRVGDIDVELLHTPGHTPGSSCFRVRLEAGDEGSLIAGDTLFLQGCGRVDLPGGDVDEMYRTLSERLATLPGATRLLPGHAYGGESASFSEVRRDNATLRIGSLEAFRRRMG